MKRNLISIVVMALALIVTGAALAGTSVELRQRDGSRWRGQINDMVTMTFEENRVPIELKGRLVEVSDLYVIVEGALAGEVRKKVIFKSDIISISTAEPGALDVRDGARKAGDAANNQPGAASGGSKLGVFVLPLDGTVGVEFRHDEIDKLAAHCDQYGPGQIIVLIINSGGGLVTEMEELHNSIVEARKRHRVVAWIKSAISAACSTAMNCDEIYFMTEGHAGAMTAFSGETALKGAQLEYWMNTAAEWAEMAGRNGQIARAMIHAPIELSYDKDEETGEVTWHNDLSGKYVLSDDKDNLVFNASNAVHSGFADGIADTTDELAKLLDLPRWNEIDDYGRRLHDDWTSTVERGKEQVPLLIREIDYAGTGSGDTVTILGKRIQILKELLQWIDRAPNLTRMMGLPPEAKPQLERQIADLRYQIAQIRKAQR